MLPEPPDDAAPFEVTPIPPELLAWVQQTLDLEAIEREINETIANGGVSFETLIEAVQKGMQEVS